MPCNSNTLFQKMPDKVSFLYAQISEKWLELFLKKFPSYTFRNNVESETVLYLTNGRKSTESAPLFQVEYGLSLILTLLSCFEWFQNFCYHNFRLTSLRTHLITEESSIELGEGTCYTNIQLFFT